MTDDLSPDALEAAKRALANERWAEMERSHVLRGEAREHAELVIAIRAYLAALPEEGEGLSTSAAHASDCAVHNMPALPPGDCDCDLGAAAEDDQPTSGFLQVEPETRPAKATGTWDEAWLKVAAEAGWDAEIIANANADDYIFVPNRGAASIAKSEDVVALLEQTEGQAVRVGLFRALSLPQQADGPPKGEPGED